VARLRGKLRFLGLTLTDLAQRTGLSVHTCCTVLKHGRGYVDSYIRLCIALGLPTCLSDGVSPTSSYAPPVGL